MRAAEQTVRAPGGPRRPRARRTPPEQRRLQLLDTAERLLAEGGSDALRMDALARAAGVTRPVVYEHFEDREGLIVALLERHAERVAAGVAASARPGTFEDELRAATRAYLTAARRSGGPMRGLVAAENLSPAIEAARRRYWGAAAAVWADRYRERTGLPAPDAHALAVAHLAALSALAGLCIRGAIGIARATDLHVVSCLAALDALSPPEEQP